MVLLHSCFSLCHFLCALLNNNKNVKSNDPHIINHPQLCSTKYFCIALMNVLNFGWKKELCYHYDFRRDSHALWHILLWVQDMVFYHQFLSKCQCKGPVGSCLGMFCLSSSRSVCKSAHSLWHSLWRICCPDSLLEEWSTHLCRCLSAEPVLPTDRGHHWVPLQEGHNWKIRTCIQQDSTSVQNWYRAGSVGISALP